MSLILMHPRIPKYVPAATTPAQFLARTYSLAADVYYGTDSSAVQPELSGTSGLMTYQIFKPSSAAIIAQGWQTTDPFRVLVVLHGDGEKGFEGTKQMMGTTGTIPQILGWGANQDGSLAVPSTTCPLLCIFPQRPLHWTGSGGSDGNSRGRRVTYQLIDAALAAVASEFSIDTNRVYLTGLSGGGFIAAQYIYQRWNRGLGRNIAMCISTSSCLAYNYTEGVPGIVISPATESQAATVEAPGMIACGTPWWHYNGDLDGQVPKSTWFQYTAPAMVAAGATNPSTAYTAIEYADTDHTGTWARVHGTMSMTADPWLTMLTQHL